MVTIQHNTDFINAIRLWFINPEKCEELLGHISEWDVSNVDEMAYAFYNKKEFKEDISKWNVSNVSNMYSMFEGATGFNCDISKWKVNNVNNTIDMFKNCNIEDKNKPLFNK